MKVFITLQDWTYECGDGCCFDAGVSLIVNGVECNNQNAGGDVEQALVFTLKQLGFEAEITSELLP